MFKKSLIAAAMMAVVSAPSYANVSIEKTGFVTTTLAEVTKQAVLDFSTAEQNVEVTFTQLGDLKQNGFVTLEISGDASFNASEVRQWLTLVGGNYSALTFDLNGGGAPTSAQADIEKLFKTTQVGGDTVIEHAIDMDGKRLRMALVANGDADENIIFDNTAPNPVLVGAGTQLDFNLDIANQIFRLQSGSQGTVALKVGALRNASYTADPVATPALFKLDKLFELQKSGTKKATALVAERFTQLNVGQADVASDGLQLVNLTTNQNIQLDKVNLEITGNFSGFRADNDGNLLDAGGANTGWKVTNGVATSVAGNTVLEGLPSLDAAAPLSFLLAVAADNTAAIEGQTFNVKASINGVDQATFEDFSHSLADVVIIDRDGMKFDTITTGTTAANLIFVRDISKILPDTGGKIFVTITEYDLHGVNGRGEGTVLADRAELSTTLPSGGAVTLAPAEVAAEVGASITAGRQARFVFEVETNRGEVAVKKSNSEGVDIQNGTKGVEDLVDFTL